MYCPPSGLQQELPAPILDDVAGHSPVEPSRLSCDPPDGLDAMKIAWRYQNLPKVQVTFQNVHITFSITHALGAHYQINPKVLTRTIFLAAQVCGSTGFLFLVVWQLSWPLNP